MKIPLGQVPALLALPALLAFSTAPLRSETERAILVLDASGSMWGQIGGKAKITIAKEVIGQLVPELELELGLMAYGHRREGDCDDIELLIPPGTLDHGAFLAAVEEITPRGKTPLTKSVRLAAEMLGSEQRKSSVILVSDGIENCDGDICALARQLEKDGVDFTAHVVAFDLTARDARTMECLARETGGRFLAAQDADGLKDALDRVVEAVVEEPPEPEPEVERQEAALEAPAKVTAGTRFEVGWTCKDHDPSDFITILPAGSEEGLWENFTYVSRGNPLELLAPIGEGDYEVRYLARGNRRTLARCALLVEPVSATLTIPPKVAAGSSFEAGWTGPDQPGDYLTVVPAGARQGTYGKYEYTQKGSPAGLTAPVDAGAFEVRYVSGQKAEILARSPFEVTAVSAGVKGPAEVEAGSRFSVEWSGPGNQGDYITIVPKGAGEGTYKSYAYTRDQEGPVEIQAPIETGDFEIRYVTGQKARTLARAAVHVTAAEVAVAGPVEVTAGAKFVVEWTGPANQGDYITIVPRDARDGTYKHYAYPRQGKPLELVALEEAGPCELRYVSGQGAKTLARSAIEVKPAEVGLEAADEVVAGSTLSVSWSATIHPQDFVTIVMKDAKEGSYGPVAYAGRANPAEVTAPETPGEAEIRYLTRKGRRTLASRPLRITAASATLEVAGRLAANQPFEVAWAGPSNARDYITIVASDAPDNARGALVYAAKGSPQDLRAPRDAGTYEVRYLTGKLRKVLARTEVTVVAE